jgi:hypothetical protein
VGLASKNCLSFTDNREHKDQTEDLRVGFQNLDISNAAPLNLSHGRSPRHTTGYNLFLSNPNRVQGHSDRSRTGLNPLAGAGTAAPSARNAGPRASTPAVGRLEYGFDTGGRQSAPGGSSGYLPPQSTIGYGSLDIGQSSRRLSRTPAIDQPQKYAAGLRRPQSALVRSSSRSSDSSKSESNVSGTRVQKQQDWRNFFKPGRVCVSD